MLKRILFFVLSITSLQSFLFAKCPFDSCSNGFVFIDKNADKTGSSLCKAKDGSMKPYLYYAFRANDGAGDPVKLDANGLDPKTGLCKCGHSPWMHTIGDDNFPLDSQTQKPTEIPLCPEGY